MSLTLAGPESAGMSAARLERIRPAMQAYVDSGLVAGIHTVIARRGKVVHDERTGLLDPTTALPLPADAIYRIYSMTKPIVCVALMTLYEEGRFQLYAPAAQFLPGLGALKVLESAANGDTKLADLARPITVADLMTHTAGFTYDFLVDSPVAEIYRQVRPLTDPARPLGDAIAELLRLPLAYQPGSRWHYSLSIDVAAHLVEVISGRPLRDFLCERLFAPLGMVDTDFAVAAEKQHRIVAMRGVGDLVAKDMTIVKMFESWMQGTRGPVDVTATYPVDKPATFVRGGHGLFSTVYDYLRFAQMMLNGGELDGSRILGRKTLELMHTNHIRPALLPYEIGGVPALGYGFGLGSRVMADVGQAQLLGTPGEFGWGGAAKTYYWVDPKEEMVGLFMTQLQGMDEPDRAFRTLAYQAIVD
jgi:CubicO group peptidase (beta-lactamase class C family)